MLTVYILFELDSIIVYPGIFRYCKWARKLFFLIVTVVLLVRSTELCPEVIFLSSFRLLFKGHCWRRSGPFIWTLRSNTIDHPDRFSCMDHLEWGNRLFCRNYSTSLLIRGACVPTISCKKIPYRKILFWEKGFWIRWAFSLIQQYPSYVIEKLSYIITHLTTSALL